MCEESNTKSTTIIKTKFLLSVLCPTTITTTTASDNFMRFIRFGTFVCRLGFFLGVLCLLFTASLHSSYAWGGISIRQNWVCWYSISFSFARIRRYSSDSVWPIHLTYSVCAFRTVLCMRSNMTTSAITTNSIDNSVSIE